MPERKPRRRRVHVSPAGLPPRRPLRRARQDKPNRALPRCSSEPILWTVRFVSNDGDRAEGCLSGGSSAIGDALFLPRPHTWANVFSPVLLGSPSPSPSPSPRPFVEGAKVVVSVTVEGSPGPVRAMVQLGATVGEAIGVVVDKYGKEGRSPKLDRRAMNSFQLHHSHFSLQSLNKSEKIGEVGGRSFYLRKSCGTNSINLGSEGCDTTAEGGAIEPLNGSPRAIIATYLFPSFIARRLKKFGRRTRKLWKVVICMACG